MPKSKNHKVSFSKKKESHKFFAERVELFYKIIQNTLLSIQRYKTMDIFGASELNICVQNLETIQSSVNNVETILSHPPTKIDYNDVIERLQKINNELSVIFKTYGTNHFVDLVNICFGNDYLTDVVNNTNKHIYDVVKKYVHPISYKALSWKNNHKVVNNKKIIKNRIVEDFMIVDQATTFDCFDLARTSKNFQTKVYGIKVALQNTTEKKTLIINGIVDDIGLDFINDSFIKNKVKQLKDNNETTQTHNSEYFDRFIDSLTVKELLVYNNHELNQRFVGYNNQSKLIKQKTISTVIKEFISSELYGQRTMLIQLLIRNSDPEFQYLAYLLYDLLSNESNNSVDTYEQTLLFDSLPWIIKKYFRDAMKVTIKYTKNLSNIDNHKIPIEQQICLMKAPDSVKEKAMNKLKEVKAKSEDSGSKAQNYLDGLLKIPFGVYKEEPILMCIKIINDEFKTMINELEPESLKYIPNFPILENYSSIELFKYMTELKNNYVPILKNLNMEKLLNILTNKKREGLIVNVCHLNNIMKKNNIKGEKICHSGKKNSYMKNEITKFVKKYKDEKKIINDVFKQFEQDTTFYKTIEIEETLEKLLLMWSKVNDNIKNVREVLDESVYGHTNAKRQLERIIGQWMNGEHTGYCFGFEGPPGVGKTSLAKNGLANCLKDENDVARPFSFIALGGSSNGSTLSGHSYTYVGSTWGRIVDILMEQKCMNPIIFIDELDKVSKTEHGKEIIGILTHMVDPTQNEHFQDKYFSGIDFNLSRVLFIFSYNNPELIDPILLDRIHRIKFKNLSLEDKVIITRKHILPELFKRVGLTNTVEFSDDIIKYIVENYTKEAGVRKLKEILFEIISEINLEIIQSSNDKFYHYVLTEEDVKNKYLKERLTVRYKEIHNENCVGIINGLWANALGMGGIIPIESNYFPSTKMLDLKLTGMQGDVMKESMNVAMTLAWKLSSDKTQKQIMKENSKNNLKGVHIHCPEGAVPKDGPSAGTAITCCIYSLLNKKPINRLYAITGEIDLQGNITAIGGLDLKILGGIRAGVKHFIYPEENKKDYDKFLELYKDNDIIKNIEFFSVKHITEVLKMIF